MRTEWTKNTKKDKTNTTQNAQYPPIPFQWPFKPIQTHNSTNSRSDTSNFNRSAVAKNVNKAEDLNSQINKFLNTSIPAIVRFDLPNLAHEYIPAELLCIEEELDTCCPLFRCDQVDQMVSVYTRILKNTVVIITPGITKLFNIPLSHGKLPSKLETPIPRSTKLSDPNNYTALFLHCQSCH